MITDKETNLLFLADILPIMQPVFYRRFKKVLDNCKIQIQLLPGTRDIWTVDYMPVQINENKFVQFTYNPDYLKDEIFKHTLSDYDRICKAIKLSAIKSKLVIDGGNISRSKDKVIMCDKVFKENPLVPKKNLIKQLRDIFEVDEIFFVPWDENDIIGHADGMVRFLDNDTVLINDYSGEPSEFQRSFKKSLQNARINFIEIPYNPTNDINSISAKGIYINYLQMQQAVFVPVFKDRLDDKVLRLFEQIFIGQPVVPVNANEIAKEGGVLNCITWNIKI